MLYPCSQALPHVQKLYCVTLDMLLSIELLFSLHLLTQVIHIRILTVWSMVEMLWQQYYRGRTLLNSSSVEYETFKNHLYVYNINDSVAVIIKARQFLLVMYCVSLWGFQGTLIEEGFKSVLAFNPDPRRRERDPEIHGYG